MKTKAKTEAQKEYPTVRQYAEANGYTISPVRRAIADGFLVVDRDQKPMRVVGGDMPLTVQRWRQKLEPVVAKLKPSLYGWSEAPARLDVLCGAEVKTFEYAEDWRLVPKVLRDLEQIAEIQHGRLP